MNYDVDYFIRKFEAIPEEKWLQKNMFFDRDLGKGCAIGWCGFFKPTGEFVDRTPESKALIELFLKHIRRDVILINDGDVPQYNQPTPRQRILAALHDIRKMQQPKREKVKPSISPDLLAPPIPKEEEKIDRHPQSDLFKMLGDLNPNQEQTRIEAVKHDSYNEFGPEWDAGELTI